MATCRKHWKRQRRHGGLGALGPTRPTVLRKGFYPHGGILILNNGILLCKAYGADALLLSSSCTYLVHEDYHGFPRFVSNQIPSSCEIWEPATHDFGWFNPHLGGLATRILHPLCALLCVSCILLYSLYSVLHGFAKLWHFYFYPLQTPQNRLKGRDYMEVRTWFHVFVPFNQSIQPPLQPLVSYIIISYHNMLYRYVVM